MLPSLLYTALLNTCAHHQNIKEAIRIFHYLEKCGVSKPSTSVHAHLLNVYMSVNDVKGACVVFDKFRNICTQGKIPWNKSNLTSA